MQPPQPQRRDRRDPLGLPRLSVQPPAPGEGNPYRPPSAELAETLGPPNRLLWRIVSWACLAATVLVVPMVALSLSVLYMVTIGGVREGERVFLDAAGSAWAEVRVLLVCVGLLCALVALRRRAVRRLRQ